MRHYPLLCVTAALAIMTANLDSGGQANQASESHTPAFRSTTRAVVVDVVVTNATDAIRGLKKQDFQLSEDGKLQAIDFFEEHSANRLSEGAVPPLPKMPPGVYTNVPPVPQNDSVNVLLLDALNTDQAEQSYVRQNILNFLKSMPPGTRAAIFTLSSRLRLVQGFTSDSSSLVAAVNDPKFGVQTTTTDASRSLKDKQDDALHLDKALALLGGRSDEGISAMVSFQHEFANYQAGDRVAMTLEALQYMARYLAGVPGRKNLLWFSTSFPVAVFPRLGQSQRPNQINADSLDDYTARVKKTADLLTVSKIAVYPIGAEGVMSEHIFEANLPSPTDYEGVSEGNNSAAQAKGGNLPAYVHEYGARSDKIMSMEQLAADTGGKAYYNTNDLNAAMQKAIADGSHYYTLVYTPTNKKMDGSYRRIEVKVNDAKYRLAYRRGYNADDVPAAAQTKPDATPLHGMMMYEMPDATQILFAARVLPANPQPSAGSPRAGRNAKLSGATTRYSIDYMIRWTDVKFDVQSDGTHTGKLDVQLLAYDRDGNALNWTGGTQAMSIKPDIFEAIKKSGVPVHVDIDVPSDKDIYLETGVYDWETGKAGTLEIPLLLNASGAAKSSSLAPAR